MTKHEESLGEFLKKLTAELCEGKIPMPFRNERPWHVLFYELKTTPHPDKPPFLDELEFDWDGPYPRSRELSDFLHALHWNASVSASNPYYETMTLPKEVAELWFKRAKGSNPELLRFLNESARRAAQLFSDLARTEGAEPANATSESTRGI